MNCLKPWITPGLIRCMRHRDRLHLKCKKDPTNIILNKSYKRYKNFCNNLLKDLRNKYEREELTKYANNPKKKWKIIDMVTNRNNSNKKTTATDLLYTEKSPEISLQSVNTYFSNIAKDLADKIIPCNTDNEDLTLSLSPLKSMVMLGTSEQEIDSIINSLKSDSAVGWDAIPTKVLKMAKNILTVPLTHIVNLCIEKGVFPKVFKKSIIHPIFKAGDRNCVGNYRPISVLTSLSKVLEKIVNKRLVTYLEDKHILSNNQFGFRQGKSTEQAVSELVNFVAKHVDNKDKCLGVFLDLAKAFDTTWEETKSTAELGLHKISNWLNLNKLTLNVTKTNYILFNNTERSLPLNLDYSIQIHTCKPSSLTCSCDTLAKSKCIKYLGVLLDDKLTWCSHINKLTTQTRKLIYIFKKLRNVADQSLLRTVYLSLAQSVLSYCITSWGGARKSHLIKLERAQRILLKTIKSKPYRYPTGKLYSECNVLTVRKLFILNATLSYHQKSIYNTKYNSSTRRKDKIFPIDSYKSFYMTKFLCFLGPLCYNKINKILNIYPLNTFQCKQKLTTWLKTKGYEEVEELFNILK
ncbi:hypothetical protein K1T71_004812 [Dendrolimus kikuchii]|uniref:Uncharacterized protein n=1 Tax=Dendrolimus kikuchii TaxID=765133 RepID=A0ACC1D5G8_9NEOP|nr:hypothetical protein K1T71_004812 [Dendrolimus kikuchii]